MGALWLVKGPTFIQAQCVRLWVLYGYSRVRHLFRLNVRDNGCSMVSQGSDVYSDSMCAIMGALWLVKGPTFIQTQCARQWVFYG